MSEIGEIANALIEADKKATILAKAQSESVYQERIFRQLKKRNKEISMKRSSIEAYHKIKSSGLLSKRRWETYDMVYQLQPCSIKMAVNKLDPTKWSTYSARFSELEKMGLIEVSGQVHDFETKQTVNTYVTTDRLPSKLPTKKRLNIQQASKIILEYMEQNNLAFIYRSQLEMIGE